MALSMGAIHEGFPPGPHPLPIKELNETINFC